MKIFIGLTLMALITPSFADEEADKKKSRVMQDLQSLGSSLEMYKNIGGSYPTTKQGLKSLLKKPNDAPRPRRWVQALAKMPLDPWGREYCYETTKGYFKLWSKGPDPKKKEDDIVRPDPKKWRKGR